MLGMQVKPDAFSIPCTVRFWLVQYAGTLSYESEKLLPFVNGHVVTLLVSLSAPGFNRSGPDALFFWRFDKISMISCSVMFILSRLLQFSGTSICICIC